jgi:hypothetical protein
MTSVAALENAKLLDNIVSDTGTDMVNSPKVLQL